LFKAIVHRRFPQVNDQALRHLGIDEDADMNQNASERNKHVAVIARHRAWVNRCLEIKPNTMRRGASRYDTKTRTSLQDSSTEQRWGTCYILEKNSTDPRHLVGKLQWQLPS